MKLWYKKYSGCEKKRLAHFFQAAMHHYYELCLKGESYQLYNVCLHGYMCVLECTLISYTLYHMMFKCTKMCIVCIIFLRDSLCTGLFVCLFGFFEEIREMNINVCRCRGPFHTLGKSSSSWRNTTSAIVCEQTIITTSSHSKSLVTFENTRNHNIMLFAKRIFAPDICLRLRSLLDFFENGVPYCKYGSY